MLNAVLDLNAPACVFDFLLSRNVNIIKTIQHRHLDNAVSSHPDMLLHQINEKTFVCEPSCYAYFRQQFDSKINLIQGSTHLQLKYPHNIAYNIARVSDIAFGKLDSADNTITEYYKNNGIKLINVNQGYAKCNTCIVSDNAIITSDPSIARALCNCLDVLHIAEGHIALKPYDHGFIGGATGLISKNELLISGSLKHHPSVKTIYDFLNKHNVTPIEASEDIPADIGSVLFFNTD